MTPAFSLPAPPRVYPDDHPGSQRSRKLCSVLVVAGVWIGGRRRQGEERGGERRGGEERGGTEGQGGYAAVVSV